MATYRALLSLKSSLDDPDSRLSALRLLNLSNNVFNRTFPPELSNLTNLRVLDLYNNNLTGVLPVSLDSKLNASSSPAKTPHKDHARPSPKLSARVSKKTVPKKSLNSAFSSISEDLQVQHSVDSTPISVISEIDEVNRDADVTEFGSIGAEVVASFLKQARIQVLNSAGVDAKSKKLLDALVEIVIEDFHTVPEERDHIAELLSAKAKILVVCSLLWILAMAVFLVFSSGAQGTFPGQLPT
ncbi:hypothetical protein ACLB2K_037224 [Fragaria x ananassa]